MRRALSRASLFAAEHHAGHCARIWHQRLPRPHSSGEPNYSSTGMAYARWQKEGLQL